MDEEKIMYKDPYKITDKKKPKEKDWLEKVKEQDEKKKKDRKTWR